MHLPGAGPPGAAFARAQTTVRALPGPSRNVVRAQLEFDASAYHALSGRGGESGFSRPPMIRPTNHLAPTIHSLGSPVHERPAFRPPGQKSRQLFDLSQIR